MRAAKGHEIDPESLSYKSGDAPLDAVRTRSNQPVIFLDSTGRSYVQMAHTLPSARGQGEPLTGRFSSPAGATFVAVVSGEQGALYLLMLRTPDTVSWPPPARAAHQKQGPASAVLSVPKGARVLPAAAAHGPGVRTHRRGHQRGSAVDLCGDRIARDGGVARVI